LDREIIKDLLRQLQKGEVGVDDVMKALKDLPFEDIGMACIDHHRGLRRGLSEVIFGEGKSADQIVAIMKHMTQRQENIMVTRLSGEKAGIIRQSFPESEYHAGARVLTLTHHALEDQGRGPILVISAGTSDIPVAEEAALSARFMGNRVETVYDVGVSGLHRVLAHREQLEQATVIIVVAGMEGALPSVVGGLVDKPVIAVPTSIGYGASFGGITALLGMLNSCASGVTVVNIDNGFGAGYAASLINRKES
jgi:NCAIR mutase (PurE)-related protein